MELESSHGELFQPDNEFASHLESDGSVGCKFEVRLSPHSHARLKTDPCLDLRKMLAERGTLRFFLGLGVIVGEFQHRLRNRLWEDNSATMVSVIKHHKNGI